MTTLYVIYEINENWDKSTMSIKGLYTNKRKAHDNFYSLYETFKENNPNYWHLVLGFIGYFNEPAQMSNDLVNDITTVMYFDSNTIHEVV